MAFEIPADLMVSVSGVRGRVGQGLTPEVVARFASAFGAWVRERSGAQRPRVVLGRDSRTSGPMFSRVVAGALQSVGCDVIDVGIAPTPTALFNIRALKADGGIVVTASHNPVEWNALKLATAAGMFLDADEAPLMRAFVTERPIERAAWDGLGDVVTDDSAVQRHLDAVLAIPYLDIDGLRRRKLRVGLECINGAGTVLLPRLLEHLGCEVVGLNMEPTGRFGREPEPVAENLGDLERLVR
jgi:phosphomannomutase